MKAKRRYIFGLLLVIVPQLLTVLTPLTASADRLDGPYVDKSIVTSIQQWDYRDAIVSCFAQDAQQAGSRVYTLDELNSGKWFHDKSERVSYYSDPGDGTWTCKEDVSGKLSTITKALGWDTPLAAACALGYKQVNISKTNRVESGAELDAIGLYGEAGFDLTDYDYASTTLTPACGTNTGGDGYYVFFGAPFANDASIASLSKAVDTARKSTNNLSDAQLYVAGWEALRMSCKLTTGSGDGLYEVKGAGSTELIDGSGTASITDKASIPVVNQDGSISYVLFPVGVPQTSIDIAPRPGYENQGWGINFSSCYSLAGFIAEKSSAYQALIQQLIANGGLEGNSTGGTTTETGGDTPQQTCTIAGIGWLVCPVATVLASIADSAKGALDSLFRVPATTIFDTKGATYQYWQQIRNYANIMFVVAFLIIIFSQVTSVGITNYGIKKLLPKLVVTAILVNVSFPICAILVDLSNILGGTLTNFLSSAATVSGSSSTEDILSQGNVFTNLLSGALLVGATAVATYFAFAAIVGLLISFVAIAVTMVILLGIRQALVILLVVLAPLAFVALLLPNTESLFKKWLKLFQSMLLVFPIASLLYGAGLLASGILMKSGDNAIVQTVGAALPVIMLVAVYKAFTSAMSGLEGLGGAIGKLRNGIGAGGKALRGASDKAIGNSRYGKWRDFKKAETDRNRQLAQTGVYSGNNPLRKLQTRYNKSRNANGSKFGERLAASGVAASQKLGQEEVDNEALRMMHGIGSENEIPEAAKQFADALASGDAVKARAAQKVLLGKGGAGLSSIRKTIAAAEASGRLHSDSAAAIRKDLAAAGVRGKDAALDKWSYTAGKTLDQLDKDKDTYKSLNDAELSTQTSLEMAGKAGALGDGRADRILGNKDLHGNLNGEKFDELNKYTAAPQATAPQSQAPSSSGASPQAQAPSAPTQPQTTTHGGTAYDQTESGLFIPRN